MDQPRMTSWGWTGRLSCFRATGCETCGRVLGLLDPEPELEPLDDEPSQPDP
jgi:hypothetical protein